MPMPELSIIIISYNTSALTEKCLETVITSLTTNPGIQAEIIVFDNASNDGSIAMMKKFVKTHTIPSSITFKPLYSDENIGFGNGNNQAVKQASGEYLLFLNSDTETLEDAIPNLLHSYKNSDFDFAGAKLLNTDNSVQLSVGRFYSLFIAFLALFTFADRWHATRYSPHDVRKVDWVSGACFITRKSLYEKLQGFDPKIFMYWEEVDLFYRASKQGYSVGFFPKPTFIHHEGASSKNRSAPIIKVFEGYLTFYKKHHSPLQVRLLHYMLQLKALCSLLIGKLTGNRYLVETYSKAYEISKIT